MRQVPLVERQVPLVERQVASPQILASFASPKSFQGTFRKSPAQKITTTQHNKLSKAKVEAEVPPSHVDNGLTMKGSTSGHKKKLKK